MDEREPKTLLERRIDFIAEVERLKTVTRQNTVIDGSRNENVAEHSWHVALMAIVLADHAPDADLDILKVVTMLLIHDIVEIDAGDTWLYDDEGYGDKREREERAAERIFGMLPEPQRDRFIGLWREFEAGESPEAGMAAALDSMQPVLNHYLTDGAGIRRHELPESLVLEKKRHMEQAAPELWAATVDLIRRSTERGLYREG